MSRRSELPHVDRLPLSYDYDPLTVMRLRRDRTARRRARVVGRTADPGSR